MGYLRRRLQEAADRLILGIEAGGSYQDFLVYPILFLYRHFLEVTIKGQIRSAQHLLDIQPPSNPKRHDKAGMTAAGKGHDLESLWAYLLGMVFELHPNQDRAQLEQATRVIDAFHHGGGDAARYPEDMKGSPTLGSLAEINLRQLREDMTLAYGALSQVEGVLDYEIDQRQLSPDALGDGG